MKRSPVVIGVVSGIVLIGVSVALFSRSAPPVEKMSRAAGTQSVFCAGVASSISQVEQNAPYQLLLPRSPLASAANVTDVCWDPQPEHGSAFAFTSGILLRMWPTDFSDPAGAWSGIVNAYPDAGYSVGIVHGQPALLAAPGGPLHLLGGAEWVENGLQLKVVGDGKIPLATLQAVAESLGPA